MIGRKPTKSYKAAGQPYDGGPADGMPFVRDGRDIATRSARTDPDHSNSGGSELGSAQPGRNRESKGNSSIAKDGKMGICIRQYTVVAGCDSSGGNRKFRHSGTKIGTSSVIELRDRNVARKHREAAAGKTMEQSLEKLRRIGRRSGYKERGTI
jgi:hypothetical protein